MLSTYQLNEVGSKLSKQREGKEVDKTSYRQIICNLMYLTTTRPDIQYVVILISRYMEQTFVSHLLATKRVRKYLQGTKNHGLKYLRGGNHELYAYTDSDYVGDRDDRKSTPDYEFVLSRVAVSWSSQKESIVSLSSTEAERIAASQCVCHALWMRRMSKELRVA